MESDLSLYSIGMKFMSMTSAVYPVGSGNRPGADFIGAIIHSRKGIHQTIPNLYPQFFHPAILIIHPLLHNSTLNIQNSTLIFLPQAFS